VSSNDVHIVPASVTPRHPLRGQDGAYGRQSRQQMLYVDIADQAHVFVLARAPDGELRPVLGTSRIREKTRRLMGPFDTRDGGR
jgi:hypothetical protein